MRLQTHGFREVRDGVVEGLSSRAGRSATNARNFCGRRVDTPSVTSDERPEEGVYTWRWDKLSYEVLVLGDGVVIAGAFLNGEILRIWDEPEGAA